MMYEYWLARVHPLSNQKKQKLRACIGSAKEIYYIEETQIYQLDFLTKKDQAVLAEAKKRAPTGRNISGIGRTRNPVSSLL